MGIKEFESMFNDIDLSRNGFVTPTQLHKFCEDLYLSSVCKQHVDGAVKLMCQSKDRVTQTEFLDVLTEIERRRSIDEQAYWDFKALDYYGSGRIALRDGLFLFRDFHGENFSMAIWKRFLGSRDYPDSDIYFDEIRFWLCNPAAGQPCSDKELKQTENQLLLKQTQFKYSNYVNLKNHIDDDEGLHKEKEDHYANVAIHAKRKLNKWNREGVEAMLFDDGFDLEEAKVKVKPKGQVSMGDLKDMLQMKYDALTQRLMMEMAKLASPIEDELDEVLNQIRTQTHRLIREGGETNTNIPGSQMQLLASLTGLMGELGFQDKEHRRQIEQLKIRLKSQGKTPREINTAVQQRYEKFISGDSTASGILVQLHQRQNRENEELFSRLKQSPQSSVQQAILLEYSRIMRQLLAMEEEHNFIAMATTAGLAERAMEPKMDRSDWDRSRSERLAEMWLKAHIGTTQIHTPKDLPDDTQLNTAEITDIWVCIVREVTQKHYFEREALINMLLSKEFASQVVKAKKVKQEDRKHQLKGLYNQHLSWKSNPKASISFLHNILNQALWLTVEERRQEILDTMDGGSLSDDEMREILLADLQQRQGLDFEMLLQDLQSMSREEAIQAWKKQCVSRVSEVYDNIAAVVLGSLDITAEDEEYIKTLEGKYDVLRKRILLMSLKDSLDWINLPKDEKRAALKDISTKERGLRSEGKLQMLEKLLGPNGKNMPTLRNLLGEDKAEFKRRKQQYKEDEDLNGPIKPLNLLADLVPRHDNEYEDMLSWLHSPEVKAIGLRMKRMRIVEMKVEMARVEMEEEFDIAAFSMGLMERVMETLSHRHAQDLLRQKELAKNRMQVYRRRIQQCEEFRKEPGISKDKMPKRGDITGLQVVYVCEMLKRHVDERELMLSHLLDESMEDLLEAAARMSDEERQKRLVELLGKHQNLNLTIPDDQEEHVCILEEAAAIRMVSVKQQLGQGANMDSVCVTLLAELQEGQDREVALTLQQIENMNEEDIHTCLSREINNRKLGTSWNVIDVFTRYQGEATNENILKALDEKYTLLRQQLLTDSLRIRMGSDKWEQFSAAERQQKVMALDVQAQEQIRLVLDSNLRSQEEKGHILTSLLGDDFSLKETVEESMGVCPHVFRNKVKGQQVLGYDSNLHMEETDGAVSKKKKNQQPMKDLHNRFEEERLALVRQLKGQSEDYISEQERQVLLSSYHRQCMLAEQEETFPNMATLLGLLERQQQEIKFRLIKDRRRYQTLGKQLVIRIRVDRPHPEHHVDLTSSCSVAECIDRTLKLLDNKHIQERQMFYQFLVTASKKKDIHVQASLFSQQQRLDKMAELRKERSKTLEVRKMEDLEALSEATVYKKEDRRCCQFDTDDYDEDELCGSLLGDLLEYQNAEAQSLIMELVQKDTTDIAQFQSAILNSIKVKMADNVALVVLHPDRTDGATEDDLIEALKGKYDALKDKLLSEALMRELGETEWKRLSEAERQKKIFELKMRERKLRKEGKIDEANALLDELLKDQEHLRKLMGDTTQQQKDKLQERLKKRHRRLAEGMSPEEIDALERESLANEEAEESNEERNLMEDLNDRFEQEKAELLRQLKEAGDMDSQERERQIQLARLRREQRGARKEDNFTAAALILGLSEKQEKEAQMKRDADRARQERLAHERIAAARERKAKGQTAEDIEEEVDVNPDDPASLQEAIARNLDKKQRKERDMFIQLLDENVEGKFRKAARTMSKEEREDKIYELSEMHKNWVKSQDRKPSDEVQIFNEAAGTELEIVSEERSPNGQSTLDEDVMASLLANLQEEQKSEAQTLLDDIEHKSLKELQQLHKAQQVLDQDSRHENISTVLLDSVARQPRGQGHDDTEKNEAQADVVKALQDKYDAMKDKLLIEALMKEHGERQWNMMSETERQKKLIELKVKERRLRREGKMDEIANLIGSHLENEKLLDELLGGSKKTQKQRLQERLARRKELIAEREADGAPTDDKTIDTILDEEEKEEERKKRRNILETLQSNFDQEKNEILRTLSLQKDKLSQERDRQIALAKLKREKRLLEKSEKLETVATIIYSAKEDDRKREQGIESELERQRNIARERLEARKKKKQLQLSDQEIEAKLKQEDEIIPLKEALMEAEGQAIQEGVMVAIEDKQEEEMTMLMSLLDRIKADKALISQTQAKSDAELKAQMTGLEQEEMKWKAKSKKNASQAENLTGAEKDAYLKQVTNSRSELTKLLTQALVVRLEVEKRHLAQHQPTLTGDKLEEELQVTVITSLQEKQSAENRAVFKLIEEQDETTLQKMRKAQHIAHREGWMDNLVLAIFHISLHELDMDEQIRIEESFQEALTKMDQELESKRDSEIAKAKAEVPEGETFDAEAVTAKLMKEFDDKKQQVLHEMEEQKANMLKKLKRKQMTAEQKTYEDQIAKQLLKMAKEQSEKFSEAQTETKDKQKHLLQQRLAERREARSIAKDVRESMERENTLDMYDDDKTSTGRSSSKLSTPPPFGLRREKTVVDVDVTEEQKQAILSQMVSQQRTLQNKITEQQERQKEMLKRRLEARQGKQKDEAAEVLSLGQRQKTVLEKSKQDEKERQISKMKAKVSRLREGRENSPSGPRK